MRDAVDLIGKPVVIEEKKYIISNISFLPLPVQPDNYIWFGLSAGGSTVNYPYKDLLPYLKEQIKL
jgi:hypothetical protein